MKANSLLLRLVVALGVLAVPFRGAAQDTLALGEVTVTAVKQGAAIDRAPVSATVLDRSTVEQTRTLTVRDASTMVPNLMIPEYGSRMTSTIYLRGLGARIDQPSMGLVVDNVAVMSKENYDIDLPDISRVEVLRGPQSTLYGRNTMAGQMNVYTLSPRSYQGTRAMAEWASHTQLRAAVSHYARPSQSLAWAVMAHYGYHGGAFTNDYNGGRCDREHLGGARVKLEWTPAPGWDVANVLWLTLTRQGGYPYEYTTTGRIAYNDTCFYRRTSLLDGLTISRRWAGMTLTGITSFQLVDDNMTIDQDFTPEPYFTLTQKRREWALTHDAVLRSTTSSRYQWLCGAFGFYRHVNMSAPVTFKDVGIARLIEDHVNQAIPQYPISWDGREFVLHSDFVMPSWGVALYHRSSYRAGDFTFTAGIRLDIEHVGLRYHSETHTGYDINQLSTGTVYAHENIDIDDHGHIDRTFVQPLPMASVQWQPQIDGRLEVYATMSKGYKAGGYNTQMFSDVLKQRLMSTMGIGATYDVDRIVGYDPEKAWNYELGAKWGNAAGTIKADAALFYMDCRDRQLTVFPDGVTTGRVMTNAGRSRSCGVEGSLTLLPVERALLMLSYGYTHATFTDYNDGVASYDGNDVPYVPRHTLQARAAYDLPLAGDSQKMLTFAADVRGVGPIHWNEAGTAVQPFYALLGAQVAFTRPAWSLTLWGRNLTNTRYNTFYFVSIGHEFVQRAVGRTLGVTLRVNINRN